MLAGTTLLLGSANESPVNIDVDVTLIGQVVLLILLLVILKPLLFEPMLKLFEEREKRIDGAKKAARVTDKKSAQAEDEFNQKMAEAQAAGNREREKLRAEGVKAENEVLAKVRAETAQILDAGRKQARADLATARTSLTAGARDLGKELAARALGREL
jgi:F-type H+-transporting ATPase subunit b